MADPDAGAVAAAAPGTGGAAVTRRGRRPTVRRAHRLFVVPAVVALVVVGLYPLAFTIAAAISESTLGAPFRAFVGGANLVAALENPDVVAAVVRTVLFALAVAVVSTVLGSGVALALHRLDAGAPVRALLLLPLLTAPVAVAILWKLILTPSGGLLDTLLRSVGRQGAPLSVLSDPGWAIVGVAAADVWEWTPLVVLLVYAALLGQDREVGEAAALDGASGVHLLRWITLPAVAGAIVAAFLVRLIIAFKVFDLVAVLTAGGPGTSTSTSSYLVYQAALQQFDVGRASAITLILAIVVTIVTLPVAGAARRLHRVPA